MKDESGWIDQAITLRATSPLTHKQIADAVGKSPAHVSRVLNRPENRDKIAERRGENASNLQKSYEDQQAEAVHFSWEAIISAVKDPEVDPIRRAELGVLILRGVGQLKDYSESHQTGEYGVILANIHAR